MIKKLFEKHETSMCLLLIVLYIEINLFCTKHFGITDIRSAAANTVFSAVLILIVIKLKRVAYYGLTKVSEAKKYLYFLPLALIVSVNLWNGININYTAKEIACHIITMVNVGFAEELIFRGFLFRMMEKDNVKTAIAVSSITFGIGHIINLINGAELIPTLLQVCYAISVGYLFVIIFHKSKSIVPCIIAHSLTNSLSIFNVKNEFTLYVSPVFLIIMPLVYAIYIQKAVKNS
ncbi:MAG: CPBP family intramembrane metalloprotease [Clostridia bacterium]|nr:CPBP family intramembrane metalloprotease [Clostridia bacterium]